MRSRNGTAGAHMRPSDEVWNRACADVTHRALTQAGDRALVAMLLVHSLAMNGGLLHAVESCASDEVHDGINGYRYFGLHDAADVVRDVVDRWGDGDLDLAAAEALEIEADERYAQAVADDAHLISAFELRFEERPSEFAPLQPSR